MRRGSAFAAIAGVALFAGGAANASDTLDVAFFLPLSGEYAPIGGGMRTAADISLTNGSHDARERIFIHFIDNCSDIDSASAAVKSIAAKADVDLILGGYPSRCCAVISAAAYASSIPHLIVASSADTLTRGNRKSQYRIAPPASEYNDGMMSMASSVFGNERPLSLLYTGDPVLNDEFADWSGDLSQRWRGRVAFSHVSLAPAKLSATVNGISTSNPVIVTLLAPIPQIPVFLGACRAANWFPSAFILGAVGMVAAELTETPETESEYIYGPSIWTPDLPYPNAGRFARQFFDATGSDPDYRAAEAFAAIEVLLNLVTRLDRFDRRSIADGLDALDMLTVFGRVKFEDYGGFQRQNRVRTSVVQMLNGKWRTVWPLELAEASYVYPAPDWRERAREPRKDGNNFWLLALLILVIVLMLRSAASKRKDLLKRMKE